MAVRHAFVVGLLLGAVALAGPAFADARDISVGGVYICTITHDWGSVSSYDRAREVNRRITQVLSTPRLRQGAVVVVREGGGDALVTVGDLLVFTVTKDDAAGTSLKPAQVARQWAALLAQGLSKALPDSTFHF